MGNPTTPPAPLTEAPDIQKISDLEGKKTDVLGYLASTDMSEDDKKWLQTKYEEAVKELSEKHTDKRERVLWIIKTELEKLKKTLASEKKDKDEAKDDNLDDGEADAKKDGKLHIEGEVKTRLDDFKAALEQELNKPETPTEPEKPQEEEKKEIKAQDVLFPEWWTEPPTTGYINKDNQIKWSLQMKIMEFLAGLPLIWGLFSRQIDKMYWLDFWGDDTLKSTLESAIKLWWESQSPSLRRVVNMKHLRQKEFLEILQYAESKGLDLTQEKNAQAAFGYRHLEDGGLRKYHRVHKSIETLIASYEDTWYPPYNPVERMKALIDGSQDPTLDEYIEEDLYNAQGGPSEDDGTVPPPVEQPKAPEAPLTPDQIREKKNKELQEAEAVDTEFTKATEELTTANTLPAADTTRAEKIKMAQARVDAAKVKVKEKVAFAKDQQKQMVTGLEKTTQDLERRKGILDSEVKIKKEALSKMSSSDPNKASLEVDIQKLEKDIANMILDITNLTAALTKIKAIVIDDSDTGTAVRATQKYQEAGNTMMLLPMLLTPPEAPTTTPGTSPSGSPTVPTVKPPEWPNIVPTETISAEVAQLVEEAERIANEYTSAGTERRKIIKNIVTEKLKAAKDKQTQAVEENKKTQANYAAKTDDKVLEEMAKKSDEAIKKIEVSIVRIENAMKKVETEGASELEPLDPADSNNLVYFNNKLYQAAGYWYKEVYYDGELKRSMTWDNLGSAYTGDREGLAKKWCKVIPYGEANTIIKQLNDQDKWLTSGGWIYVDQKHFAGKLRNIKVN
jgi:hypothetical protein